MSSKKQLPLTNLSFKTTNSSINSSASKSKEINLKQQGKNKDERIFHKIGKQILSKQKEKQYKQSTQDKKDAVSIGRSTTVTQKQELNHQLASSKFINESYSEWPRWKIPFDYQNYANVVRNSIEAKIMIQNYYQKHPEEFPEKKQIYDGDYNDPFKPMKYLSTRDLLYLGQHYKHILKARELAYKNSTKRKIYIQQKQLGAANLDKIH